MHLACLFCACVRDNGCATPFLTEQQRVNVTIRFRFRNFIFGHFIAPNLGQRVRTGGSLRGRHPGAQHRAADADPEPDADADAAADAAADASAGTGRRGEEYVAVADHIDDHVDDLVDAGRAGASRSQGRRQQSRRRRRTKQRDGAEERQEDGQQSQG